MPGLYYIIGGVGSPKEIYATFNNVAYYSEANDPTVVYIDAADGNKHEFTNGFEENFKNECPEGKMVRLDLVEGDSFNEDHANTIENADIIYMNGGDPLKLRRAVFEYTDCMEEAYNRGAVIGGQSAGGIVLAKGYAMVNGNGEHVAQGGLGLLDNYIVTAHIENKGEAEGRIKTLQQMWHEGGYELTTMLAVSSNAAAVFSEDSVFLETGLEYGGEVEGVTNPQAYIIDPRGRTAPLCKLG